MKPFLSPRSVTGGFAAATVLTLLFLPALYVAWFGIREPVISS